MRDYGVVTPRFWIGETGRCLRGDAMAQVVALYLVSSPHANIIGLYYLPIGYIAGDTGSPFEGASKALAKVCESGFAKYDKALEVVFVPSFAKFQVGPTLGERDKRRIAVLAELRRWINHPFSLEFAKTYASAYGIKPAEFAQGASKGLRRGLPSQDQDQDQEQDHKNTPSECSSPSAEPTRPPKKAPKPTSPPDPEREALGAWCAQRWNDCVAFYRNRDGSCAHWPTARTPKKLANLNGRLKEYDDNLDAFRRAFEDRLVRAALAYGAAFSDGTVFTPNLAWILTSNGWEKAGAKPRPEQIEAAVAQRANNQPGGGLCQLDKDFIEGEIASGRVTQLPDGTWQRNEDAPQVRPSESYLRRTAITVE